MQNGQEKPARSILLLNRSDVAEVSALDVTIAFQRSLAVLLHKLYRQRRIGAAFLVVKSEVCKSLDTTALNAVKQVDAAQTAHLRLVHRRMHFKVFLDFGMSGKELVLLVCCCIAVGNLADQVMGHGLCGRSVDRHLIFLAPVIKMQSNKVT